MDLPLSDFSVVVFSFLYIFCLFMPIFFTAEKLTRVTISTDIFTNKSHFSNKATFYYFIFLFAGIFLLSCLCAVTF